MDIVGIIKKSYRSYGSLISDDFIAFIKESSQNNIWITVAIILVTTGILVACYLWRKNQLRKQSIIDRLAASFLNDGQTRFRKRDKMLFYGRRMLRKVKTIGGTGNGGSGGERGRKRKAVMKFAKRLLQLQKENMQPQLKVTEPPAEYFEEIADKSADKVPPDAYFMLQSIRIFGQFEKPVFLRICKQTEILNLKAGDYLIKIGDADDSVFIVQSGQVNVFLNNHDGSSISLKVVKKGETVTSLLSFIDVIVGNESCYKTVTAKAIEDSQVIRLPMFALKEVFNENPDLLIRVIQVIMVRLQRITISALHNYLGLNIEYIQVSQKKKQGQGANPLSSIPKGYQHKRQMSDQFSLVMSHGIQASGDQQKPDIMMNDLEFPILVPRRTSTLPQQPTDIPIDVELMKSIATDGFLKELGLQDDDRQLIADTIEIKEIPPGTTLTHQGSADDVLLIYIITGGLTLFNHQPTKGTKKTDAHSINIHPGEVVGGLAVLTGETSLYTIKSRVSSRVGLINKDNVYKIMQQRPSIVLDIANSVVKGLSPLVRQCDFALDWIFLESGRAVYRQDEPSDCTYIVLNGRLRSVITHANGKKEIVGEYGKGDLIGIVEMITESNRTTTVMAVRDSELAKLPEGLFNAIKLKYPVVVTQLISLLGHRLLGSMRNATISSKASMPIDSSPAKHSFSTIAILPVSEEVPLTAFTYELYHSLSAICPTARLTADVVRKTLGMNIMESSNEYRLLSYLSQQEDHNEVTLYQCESGTLTPWTQRCLRQADVVLIVGLAERPPTIGKLEREIDRFAIRTAKELVLLHTENANSRPTNTLQWLNQRTWVNKHHHILCPKRMFTRKSQYRVNDLYTKVLNSEPNIHSDFSRLARWLTGNSVGLVLGGGGARGAAHVGMLKAIQEASIPIDMVGGVSIGAFMGALWCSERNLTVVTQKAREWCKKMTQYGLQLLDLTYPITSMFSGKQFNKTIRDTFGDNVKIEDLWIPYFTLTTDITDSCSRVHTHGSLWRYVRGSMSLAGYMPPLCDPIDGHHLLDGGYCNNLPCHLWRYVRASMTIAGVFPPMCDSFNDGHHLIDGCYNNNVPADVMRSKGANVIIAIDVGSQDDTDLTDYGDDLSGWWVLYKRYNPFTSPVKVMTIPDIQSRLAYVSCVRQLEQVKNSDYCEYLRPPIDKYKTLAFGSFDEIKEVGYSYGKEYFEKISKNGGLSRFNKWSTQKKLDESRESSPINQSTYTFVDLAQIVCKIPETCQDKHDDLSSEDDYFVGYASEPSTLRSSAKPRPLRTGGSLSLSENEYESDDSISDAAVPINKKTSSEI